MSSSPAPVNIGPRERARRRLFGLVAAVAAVGLGVWMFTSEVPRPVRLLLAVPIAGAVLGFLQAAGGT